MLWPLLNVFNVSTVTKGVSIVLEIYIDIDVEPFCLGEHTNETKCRPGPIINVNNPEFMSVSEAKYKMARMTSIFTSRLSGIPKTIDASFLLASY